MNKRILPILYALLAAVFYALNAPFSKLLLQEVPATFLASFLYLGTGVGVGILYLFHLPKEPKSQRLTRGDLPYTVGMIALDIAAPIFLMLGLQHGTASNAALLGNFEIVATTLIALLVFKEHVSKRLWAAIALITAASAVLSFDGSEALHFSGGSLLALLATVCWGLENNCTRRISDKSTYQIVTLKGLCSGAGSFLIALAAGEKLPVLRFVLPAMALGFVAYGLSIFVYIRAQGSLGAAKTSAYYAAAPFIAAALSFLVLGEKPSALFFAALLLMTAGTVFVVRDTLFHRHAHEHTHTFTHTHDGSTHTHIVAHTHTHDHYTIKDHHTHSHTMQELDGEHRRQHA